MAGTNAGVGVVCMGVVVDAVEDRRDDGKRSHGDRSWSPPLLLLAPPCCIVDSGVDAAVPDPVDHMEAVRSMATSSVG